MITSLGKEPIEEELEEEELEEEELLSFSPSLNPLLFPLDNSKQRLIVSLLILHSISPNLIHSQCLWLT
jgi:hypothetical protein